MAKFEVNERVWVRPLARYATVQRVIEKEGATYYKIEHWHVAKFSESFLMSESEREEQITQQANQPIPTDDELRAQRLQMIAERREVDPTYGRHGFGIADGWGL